MWWFIITFVVGMAVGRFHLLPTAILKRPQWFIWPSLALLLLLLGYQVGSQTDIMRNVTQLGLQGFVIAVCAIVGSGVFSFFTHRFFLNKGSRRSKREFTQAEEADS